MALYPRRLVGRLVRRLRTRPVTVLTGARQTGKTTLVRDLLPAGDSPRRYFNLDDPDERRRLAENPVSRLDQRAHVVILDEIQKQPALLDAVKLLADRSKAARFLLLGSSQILLLERVRETLAGRSTLLDLWPLGVAERCGAAPDSPTGLDLVVERGPKALVAWARDPPPAEWLRCLRSAASLTLQWGGFPPLEELPQEADRRAWLSDYRRTYLERDLADLGRVENLDNFALAQNLLAGRTAQTLSLSSVAGDLGVAVNTVRRYLRFLEISYQVFLLRPLTRGATGRLVKTPKLYWTDGGLARFLSQRWAPEEGALYETYVLGEILKWTSWRDDPPDLLYFRAHGGREIDFVLVEPGRVIGIEAKASTRLDRHDAAALAAALQEIRRPRRLGLIAYRGAEVAPLAPEVWGVPDAVLFGCPQAPAEGLAPRRVL